MKTKVLSNIILSRKHEEKGNSFIGEFSGDQVQKVNIEQYLIQIKKLSLAFSELGLKKGDQLIIFASSCVKWTICDFAAMSIGIVTVPIFTSFSDSDLKNIFESTNPKGIVVEDESGLEKILKFLPNDIVKFSIEPVQQKELKLNCIGNLIENTSKENLDQKFLSLTEAVNPEDWATIVYTSGTDGIPKGVVLSHYSLTSFCRNVFSIFKGSVKPSDTFLQVLPLDHIYGRCNTLLIFIFGSTIVFSKGSKSISSELKILKPTIILSTPSFFARIKDAIIDEVNNKFPLAKSLFKISYSQSEKYFQKIDNDISPTPKEIIARRTSLHLFFSKFKDHLGGNIRFLVSGGAPLDGEVFDFFRFANMPVLEGYGLTETFGPITINPIARPVRNSVGLPTGIVKLKFSHDGELYINTPSLFLGYFDGKELDCSAIDEEGWFRTGDLAELDSNGYLKIVGRKKDLIVTGTGRNVSPNKIENLVSNSPLIKNFILIGEGKDFLTGIIDLDKDSISKLENKTKISRNAPHTEFINNNKIREMVKDAVHDANMRLSRYEVIKNYFISGEPWTVENGLLTPSGKPRRDNIAAKYHAQINAMYQ